MIWFVGRLTLPLVPRVAGGARDVELFHHAVEQGHPDWVCVRFREDLRSDLLQHPQRVVCGESPEWIVEASEEGSSTRRPAPPEVVTQLLEPIDA